MQVAVVVALWHEVTNTELFSSGVSSWTDTSDVTTTQGRSQSFLYAWDRTVTVDTSDQGVVTVGGEGRENQGIEGGLLSNHVVGVHDHNEASGAYQHSDWETHQGEGYVGSNTWSQTYSNGGTAGVFESNGTSTWSDVRWVETTTGTSDGQVTGPVRTESGAGEGTTQTPYPTFIKSYEAVTGNWTFTLPRGGYYEDWVTVTPVEGAGTSSSTSGTPEGEGGGMESQMGDGEEGGQPAAGEQPSITVGGVSTEAMRDPYAFHSHLSWEAQIPVPHRQTGNRWITTGWQLLELTMNRL